MTTFNTNVTALDVWVGDIKIGRLERKPDQHCFTYDPEATIPISANMPVRRETYTWPQLHPIFAQNLPEGQLRESIEHAYGKEHDVSDMGLLCLTGARQIGAINYSLPDKHIKRHRAPDPEEQIALTHASTTNGDWAFSKLMEKYLLSGISGVQPKFICDLNTRTSLIGDTCIVKAYKPDATPELSYNEYFCLNAAKHAGLVVPEIYLPEGGMYLVVERFDLVNDLMTRPKEKRLAFEEVMVLQGKNNRYDGSWEGLLKTVLENAAPANRAKIQVDLFKLFVLNNCLRNGDAHLKNVGMLYEVRSGRMVNRDLAPFYDLTTTSIYQPNDFPALHHFMPSVHGASAKKAWATIEDIERMATDVCRMSRTAASDAINDVVAGICVAANTMNHFRDENPLEIYEPLRGAWMQGLQHTLGMVPSAFPKTVAIPVSELIRDDSLPVILRSENDCGVDNAISHAPRP